VLGRKVNGRIGARLLDNLRALGADVERLPKIPQELAAYIAALTPEDIKRIRNDAMELERLGILPTSGRGGGRTPEGSVNR
jgi:hypothetical protein